MGLFHYTANHGVIPDTRVAMAGATAGEFRVNYGHATQPRHYR